MDVLEDLEEAVAEENRINFFNGLSNGFSKRAISRIGTIGRQFDGTRDKLGNVIDGGTVHY